MKRVFVVEFGGTPSRTELCLLMNCGAGLYGNIDFTIYPLDKDIKSPNYVNSRAFCGDYQQLYSLRAQEMFATSGVKRRESLFDEVLEHARIRKSQENIRNLVSNDGDLGVKGSMLLDVCFDGEEQLKEVEGGYYGRADIGAVTSSFLIHKRAYDNMELIKDIDKVINEGGNGIDVVILCSSFGGTGASLGINFGEYLAERYQDRREHFRLHCIHIQPYFSFPDPDEKDRWKINSHDFYAKSASVITAYGNRKNFIRVLTEEEIHGQEGNERKRPYVFDSFYYLGQEVLDNVSQKNAAKDDQRNNLHIIDMLVAMAVEDAVNRKQPEAGMQLYGYLYSREGTDILTWEQMKDTPSFKGKHISFARFCAFVLQVIEPLLNLPSEEYASEELVVYMYGVKRGFMLSKHAKVIQNTDDEFRRVLQSVIRFCKNYITYWTQIESTTRFGHQAADVTRFFNRKEMYRILQPVDRLKNGRRQLHLDNLTDLDGIRSYGDGATGQGVYDKLCKSRELKHVAEEGKRGLGAAAVLLREIYRECKVDIK